MDSNEIQVSWAYPKSDKAPQFEVKVSIDGGAANILRKSSDMSFSIKDPTPGSRSTFSVVAIVGNQSSDPISTSVEIPAMIDTEIIQEPGIIPDPNGNRLPIQLEMDKIQMEIHRLMVQ